MGNIFLEDKFSKNSNFFLFDYYIKPKSEHFFNWKSKDNLIKIGINEDDLNIIEKLLKMEVDLFSMIISCLKTINSKESSINFQINSVNKNFRCIYFSVSPYFKNFDGRLIIKLSQYFTDGCKNITEYPITQGYWDEKEKIIKTGTEKGVYWNYKAMIHFYKDLILCGAEDDIIRGLNMTIVKTL